MKTLRKKSIVLCVILLGMLFCVSGCQGEEDFMNLKKFSIFPKSNRDKAEECIDIIFDGDEDAIFDLFSDKVKEELGEEELRRQIKELIQFYQGAEIQSKQGAYTESVGNDYGVKRITVEPHCGIETDNGDYEILFLYVVRADENPEEVGIESFQIAARETYDEEEFMWEKYDEAHGILIFE